MSVYAFGLGVNGALGLGDEESKDLPKKLDYFDEIGKRVQTIACGSYHTVFVTDDNELFMTGISRDPKNGSTLFVTNEEKEAHFQQQHMIQAARYQQRAASATVAVQQQGAPQQLTHTMSERTLNESQEAQHALTESQRICEPPKTTPVLVPLDFLDPCPSNIIKQVSLGNYHILLLTESGNVWAWGNNHYGQLGIGSDASSSLPRLVELKCVKQIATGVKHSAAINEWGELYMWGINEHGELGLGDTNLRRSPTRVSKLKSEYISMVACSSTHSVCATDTGKMYCWGQSDKMGKIQTIPKAFAIQQYLEAEIDGGGCGGGGLIKQIVCGEWQVAVLTQMGEVLLWELGAKPALLRNLLATYSVRSIAMGNFHLICLTDRGDVITLGRNKSGQLGRFVTPGAALTQAGLVVQLCHADPNRSSGKLGETTVGLKDDEYVIQIQAGEYHSVALVGNNPRTKAALQLVKMQRNYLRQLNVLSKVYHKSMLLVSVPSDPLISSLLAVPLPLPTASQANGASNQQSPTSISASGSVSSPSLLSGGGTLHRSKTTATIRSIFGLSAIATTNDNEMAITEDEINGIFSEIAPLMASTQRVLARLDARIDTWDDHSKTLGDVFLDDSVMSSYRVYIPFSDNYNSACMALYSLRRRSERLVALLKDCDRKSQTFGIRLNQSIGQDIDLKSLMLAPLQNIPRMFVALKEMADCTDPSNRDFNLLRESANKYQVLFERMNQNFQFVDATEILNCSSNEYGNPQIMGGSFAQLVDKLTHHNISDPNFSNVFLLTFRAFSTPEQLMGCLIEKFEKQPLVGTRVVNIIVSWIVNHFYDFEDDPIQTIISPTNHKPTELSKRLEEFMSRQTVDGTPNSKAMDPRYHLNSIKKEYDMQRTTDFTSRLNALSVVIPKPLTTPTISLLDFTATEIAQTMTVLDHTYFAKIDKREFLQQRWAKDKAPNIQISTDHFNRQSQIVVTEIVQTKSSKQRVQIITHFIAIAQTCLELNNLTGVASIIYGLNSAVLSKLKKTWSKVSKDTMANFEYLEKLVTPLKNYITLRHLMQSIQPPCVPFLGTYMKDLMFVEEGNPSTIGGLINFYKQRKIAEIVFQLHQYQQVLYDLQSNSILLLNYSSTHTIVNAVNYDFSDFPGASIVVTWINMALKSIHSTSPSPPPTVVSRSLAMVSTAMYDSWAFYDNQARGVYLLKQPGQYPPSSGLEKSISYAAYRVLYNLWPQARPVLNAKMAELNYDITDLSSDLKTSIGIGNMAAQSLLSNRSRDGSNQDGSMRGSSGGNYSDYTNYAPRNDPQPAAMRFPDNWQPLLVPNRNGPSTPQSFATPHWAMVKPFSLKNGADMRPSIGPPLYTKNNTRDELVIQALELISYTVFITDEIKVIAEYWADGPQSVLPPGHWHFFAMDVAKRDQHTTEEDVKMFFMLGNAVMDAGIACWDCKRFFDNSRPATMIPFIFNGTKATGWNGVCRNNVTYDLGQWIPYQDPFVVSPPFADWTSGHSTFSAASAEVLKRFTGSDKFGSSVTIKKGSSLFEGNGICDDPVPSQDITLEWPTFTSAADQAGLSRRYGGIHYLSADMDGRRGGREIGTKVFERAQLLFKGIDPDSPNLNTQKMSGTGRYSYNDKKTIHPLSRKAKKITKGGIREVRLERHTNGKNKEQTVLYHKLMFFKSKLVEGKKIYTPRDMSRMIEEYLLRNSEDFLEADDNVRTPRRSNKRDLMMAAFETEMKEFKSTGYNAPDLTKAKNVNWLLDFEGEMSNAHQQITMRRFKAIDEEEVEKEEEENDDQDAATTTEESKPKKSLRTQLESPATSNPFAKLKDTADATMKN
eukprot:gene16775-19948_t